MEESSQRQRLSVSSHAQCHTHFLVHLSLCVKQEMNEDTNKSQTMTCHCSTVWELHGHHAQLHFQVGGSSSFVLPGSKRHQKYVLIVDLCVLHDLIIIYDICSFATT